MTARAAQSPSEQPDWCPADCADWSTDCAALNIDPAAPSENKNKSGESNKEALLSCDFRFMNHSVSEQVSSELKQSYTDTHNSQQLIPYHGSGSLSLFGDVTVPPGVLAAQCSVPAARPPTTKSHRHTHLHVINICVSSSPPSDFNTPWYREAYEIHSKAFCFSLAYLWPTILVKLILISDIVSPWMSRRMQAYPGVIIRSHIPFLFLFGCGPSLF